MAKSETIGAATMERDGSIMLQLRAVGGETLGDAVFSYPAGSAMWLRIVKHVGLMKPGESRVVPAFE